MDQTDFSPEFLRKLLTYHGEDGIPYVEKFTKEWIQRTCEEKGELQIIQKYFARYNDKGLDLIDFTKELLNILAQKDDETLFLTIGLIDFYQDICDLFNLEGSAKASDILNYIIELFSNKEFQTHAIPTKKLPEPKKFGFDKARVRDIDLLAPTVYGKTNLGILRLTGSKLITDSSHHNLNTINRVHFGGETRKIFSLDSFVSYISMYDLNCIFEKKISSKERLDNKPIQIIDFSWSNKQKRIGASLKNYSLSFWDFQDDFKFEKNFSTHKFIPNNQVRIWYIEFLDVWITTDQSHSLHIWDIEKEELSSTLSSPKIKSNILDVIPLELYKLIAVASRDKKVTFWNVERQVVALEIDLPYAGVHSIAWSNAFQVFLVAGYDKNITVWNIHPVYFDATLVGELIGHEAFVTGIEVIDNTPMVVSTDETSILKLWDIRTMHCFQTMEIESIVSIKKIISLYSQNRVCFVSSRINLMEFDTNHKKSTAKHSEEELWPIKAEYNLGYNELVISTKKDMRFMDLSTGRIQKIYGGILPEEDDEITMFKITHNEKRFVLGDCKGNLGIYSYGTGELVKSLAPHTNDVMDIRIDRQNRVVISASWDCTITVQKETKTGYQIQKTVKNVHFNKGISFFEASIFHGLLLTSTNLNILYIWDYQEMRVISSIITEGKSEPTAAAFTDGGFTYLLIADSTGKIHLLHFERYGSGKISFKRIASITIPHDDHESHHPTFVNKMHIEEDYINQQDSLEAKTRLYAATNNGKIHIYNLNSVFDIESAKRTSHLKNRPDYHSERCIQEDFTTQFKENNREKFFLEGEDDDPFLRTNSFHLSRLRIPLLHSFQAHNDSLNTLTTMQTPVKKLLTTSLDGYVKIWALDGTLLGALNINHPLPRVWKIDNDDFMGSSKKVSHAIRLLGNIRKRYKNIMPLFEYKKLQIDAFLKNFHDSDSEGDLSPPVRKSPQPLRKSQIMLMKDEYTLKDLQYDKAKVIYQKELQGPTLRQMDKVKTISIAERDRELARIQKEKADEENFQKALIDAEEMKRKKDFLHMVKGYQDSPFLNETVYSRNTQTLEWKLNRIASERKKILTLQFDEKEILRSSSHERNLKKTASLGFETPEGLIEILTSTARIRSKIHQDKMASLTARNHNDVDSKNFIKLKNLQQKTPVPPLNEIPTTRRSRAEFVDYAQQKLKNINEPLTPEMTEKAQKSEAFKRKQQKKDFTKILSHLEDAKKRSRVHGVYARETPSKELDESKITPSIHLRSNTIADTDISTLSHLKSHYHQFKTEQSSDNNIFSSRRTGLDSVKQILERLNTDACDELETISSREKSSEKRTKGPVLKPKKRSKNKSSQRLKTDGLDLDQDFPTEHHERQESKSVTRGVSLPSIRRRKLKNIDLLNMNSALANKKF